MSDVAAFYDDLSAHYHLLFEDWDRASLAQGEIINRVLSELLGSGRKQILDAACGIGTQAFGLAALGHHVEGSDLSPAAIARARKEAERLKIEMVLRVADMRQLSGYMAGPYGAVCVLDNALPHLEPGPDLERALREIRAVLSPGGVFLASLRDYDQLVEERPRSLRPRVFDEPGGRRIIFQVWDWRHDIRGYSVRQYIVRDREDFLPETLVFSTDYWVIKRADLDLQLRNCGFDDLRWIAPDESGYYQPLIAARAAVAS